MAPPAALAAVIADAGAPAVRLAPAPARRPVVRPALPQAIAGALCSDPRLEGSRSSPISSGGGCGVADPVRLAAVAGVKLTRPVTVGCPTARRFADWIELVAQPAAHQTIGGSITEITSFAGYACRTRNSRPGGSLSEHARGRAIDIGAFKLESGRKIAVLDGWQGLADERSFLRAVWRGACGPFGTVLGPNADRHHRDHFHFDTAIHRSGPYCR